MINLTNLEFEQSERRFAVLVTYHGTEVHSTVTFVELDDEIYQLVFGDELLKILEPEHLSKLRYLLGDYFHGKNIELPASLD